MGYILTCDVIIFNFTFFFISAFLLVFKKSKFNYFLIKLFNLNLHNSKINFLKKKLMLTFLNFFKNFTFYVKYFIIPTKNLLKNIHINILNFYIWRPLVKKTSYFGLYSNSRINFVKFF